MRASEMSSNHSSSFVTPFSTGRNTLDEGDDFGGPPKKGGLCPSGGGLLLDVRRAIEQRSRQPRCPLFYGGMPRAKAERSLRLFAEKVLPAVQAMPSPINPALLGQPES